MASRKSSRRAAASAEKGKSRGAAVIAGAAYAYKFSGYAMRQARPWFLTGLGQFQVDLDGRTLTGTHRSSVLAIQGQDAEFKTGHYKLTGTIIIRRDGTGDASILFTRVEGHGRNVQGEFFVLLPGNADRLWLISAGQTVVNPGHPDDGEPAPELVDLEAVRVAL